MLTTAGDPAPPRQGHSTSETSRQAAEALPDPWQARFAATLYTSSGFLGVGLLCDPYPGPAQPHTRSRRNARLAGRVEPALWRRQIFLRRRGLFRRCSGFALDFAKISPVRALFLTAVINGLLAPFLLIAILLAASDGKLMQGQPSSLLSRIVVGATALIMLLAAVGMFVF